MHSPSRGVEEKTDNATWRTNLQRNRNISSAGWVSEIHCYLSVYCIYLDTESYLPTQYCDKYFNRLKKNQTDLSRLLPHRQSTPQVRWLIKAAKRKRQ